MGIDYYGVLSIARTSTDLEIKKAFRNLALQFNPERMKDEKALTVFTLICEAYEVLSEPMRRAVYDQYGEEGLKSGVPGPNNTYIEPYIFHGDPYRTYKDFFGTRSPYADLLYYLENPPPLYESSEGRGVKKKQEALYHPLKLTLDEIYHGGIKKMKIHRLVFIDENEARTEIKEKILTVPIKPGIRPGTEIRFPEEGDQNPTQIPADIIFVTEDLPHPVFTRVNDDLVMTWKLTLEEALIGSIVTVNTLDDRLIRVPITDVVFPNFEKVVVNEGMPVLEHAHLENCASQKGNLIIKFDIQFPNYLPKNSKDLLKKAFHLAKVGGGFDQPETINKLVLVDKMKRVDLDEQAPPI